MAKLKAADKRAWVAALRSGEYRQIRGTMCQWTKDGGWEMCALGIAQDVLCDGFWQTSASTEQRERVAAGSTLYTRVSYRPDRAHQNCLEQLGIDGLAQTHVVELNDLQLKSLSEIADWVEENL